MRATDPLVEKYFNSFDGHHGSTVNPLSKVEEHKLLRRWQRNKDKEALDRLLLVNLKFVVRCANKFKRYCDGKAITINDLIQAGNEGMMHAVAGFKIKKNVRFVTYATHWIHAYIRNFIYHNVSTVRVSLHNRTKAIIDQKWEAYNAITARDPDVLAAWEETFKKKYRVSEKTLKAEEQKLQTIFSQFSMDKPHTNSDGDSVNLHNSVHNEQFNTEYIVENRNEQDVIKKKIHLALRSLPQKKRDILKMRFGIGKTNESMTFKQISKKIGNSRQYMEQVEKEMLKQLKETLQQDPAIQELVG